MGAWSVGGVRTAVELITSRGPDSREIAGRFELLGRTVEIRSCCGEPAMGRFGGVLCAPLLPSMTFTPLETAAVVFGIVSVYLSVRENIWSWPTAIVNVTLYIFVFYRARLYADMALQVVYIGISVYGWYQWLHGGRGKGQLAVSRGTPRLAVILVGIGIFATALIGAVLSRYTNAALPWLDSATTTTSLIAQWMMARKILENWVVWVAVDVVYIGMFVYKSLVLTALLYAAFLVLSAMGYFQWRKTLKTSTA